MPLRDQASLFDALTEIARVEREVWGDQTDAAIMRCIAATRVRTGRAAQVSGIAATLGLSPSTVHARLNRLAARGRPEADVPAGVIARVDGGYREAAAGRRLNQQAADRIGEVLARYLRRSD